MYRLLPVPSSWNVEEVRPVVQIMARITSNENKAQEDAVLIQDVHRM